MTTPMNSQTTSSDEPAKSTNSNSELTDEQLSKTSGGVSEIVVTKSTDVASTKLLG